MTRDSQLTDGTPEGDRFRSAAADWHTRLDEDEVPAAVRTEFETWLAADSRHREAFRSVSRMWAQMGEAQADPRILALRRNALNATHRRRRLPMAFRRPFSGYPLNRLLSAAALLLMGCGMAIFGFLELQNRTFEGLALAGSNPVEGGTFRTAVGERSTVTLSDGSVIMLNTNTRVDIHFSTV